jgi:hypothetical protein
MSIDTTNINNNSVGLVCEQNYTDPVTTVVGDVSVTFFLGGDRGVSCGQRVISPIAVFSDF